MPYRATRVWNIYGISNINANFDFGKFLLFLKYLNFDHL